jgi:hypothetical protein
VTVMSAAKEINQWADRYRRWVRRARTDEQRQTLRDWEKFLRQAALVAERGSDMMDISDLQPTSHGHN